MTRASETREQKAERVYRELTGRAQGIAASVENPARVRQRELPNNVVDMHEWRSLRGRT
jgi:hypothetical protein